MSINLSDLSLPPHFSGVVRLFPLPNLVVFPGVVQALHIFEPRYRQLTEDCLASDQLLTMCLYDDFETGASDAAEPPLCDYVCICKIFSHQEVEEGRYNLMIGGLKRAKIRRELPVDQPYRMAEVDVIEDEMQLNEAEADKLRRQLLKSCENADLLGVLGKQIEIEKMLEQDVPLGFLVDLLTFVVGLDSHRRQEILALANVELRCWKLIELLGQQSDQDERADKFPPDFSSN